MRAHARLGRIAGIGLCAASLFPSVAAPQGDSSSFVRRYREGEKVLYRMTGTNQGKDDTIRYEARASGVVRKDTDGTFYEEFAWSGLRVNDARVPFSGRSMNFRERLSLSSSFRLAIPDLRGLHPGLVGPVVDLLTFYADVQLAVRESGLRQPGDHVYVNDGLPNSWADGTRILTGEDAIDFDIMLADLNLVDSVATLIVRHVPPARPAITLRASWMRDPVAESPNNWVQVARRDSVSYVASVGKETFEASIRLSMSGGRVLSATLDNLVEVVERVCRDSSLTVCGDPVRYRIRRRVDIE